MNQVGASGRSTYSVQGGGGYNKLDGASRCKYHVDVIIFIGLVLPLHININSSYMPLLIIISLLVMMIIIITPLHHPIDSMLWAQ